MNVAGEVVEVLKAQVGLAGVCSRSQDFLQPCHADLEKKMTQGLLGPHGPQQFHLLLICSSPPTECSSQALSVLEAVIQHLGSTVLWFRV